MAEYHITTEQLKEFAPKLNVRDRVYLSGVVYTSRDAAHKRIFEYMEQGKELPVQMDGAVIYYAGPTPAKPGMAIGSCGPTTSGRMDRFAPKLLDMGLAAMVGKGERNQQVIDAIIRNQAVYLCAIGGAGALACKHITSCKVIAFDDLGCESVKELIFDEFPLTVTIDCHGGNIFEH